MLNTAELTHLQAALNRSLPDVVSIRRFVRGTPPNDTDPYGSPIGTWVTWLVTVGRIASSTYLPIEREVGGAVASYSRWILTLPAGTDLLATDQVVVQGVTYEVVSLFAPRSYELARKALLERVRG